MLLVVFCTVLVFVFATVVSVVHVSVVRTWTLHTVYCRAQAASNAPVAVGVWCTKLDIDMYNKHDIVSQIDCALFLIRDFLLLCGY